MFLYKIIRYLAYSILNIWIIITQSHILSFMHKTIIELNLMLTLRYWKHKNYYIRYTSHIFNSKKEATLNFYATSKISSLIYVFYNMCFRQLHISLSTISLLPWLHPCSLLQISFINKFLYLKGIIEFVTCHVTGSIQLDSHP